MSYLRNSWYAAAWSSELAPGKLLARTLLELPIVICRNHSGAVFALQDRCPHRFAPLHRGTLVDEGLRCAYHGLLFGTDGVCLHNPQGPARQDVRVATYAAHEAHGLIWIWPGEQTKLDSATIPDLGFLDEAHPNSLTPGYTHVRANYQLLNDNIMDLSHVDFLHSSTLAQESFGTMKPVVRMEGSQIACIWEMKATRPSPQNALSSVTPL